MPTEPSNRPPGAGLRDLVAPALCYLVASLVLTYPLCWNPTTSGPFAHSEALEDAWVLSWVSHQVLRNPLALFSAPTFHPLRHALSFSEHLFVPSLFALPLLGLTDDLVLTFNVVIFIAIFSSALGMYVLLVHLSGSRPAATLGGLFYAFIPYRFARIYLLQLQFYAFLPLALVCLDRFLQTGNRRWAWGFGGFLVLQALSGWYLAAMAAVASLVALLTLVPGASRSGRELGLLAAVLVLATAIVYPFTVPYLEDVRSGQMEWALDAVGAVSANPAAYLASPSSLYGALRTPWVPEAPPDLLFPGVTLLLLGALGAAVLLAGRGGFDRPRPHVSCYGLILVAGMALSLGPKTPVYIFLHEHIVFIRRLGNVTRFGFLLFFSLCVLSSYALAWLLELPLANRRRKQLATAVAVVFLVESVTPPASIESFHDRPPEVYSWLALQTEKGAMVELPYHATQTRRLFWARHYDFRPSLAGVSPFVPETHQWMEVVLGSFPSTDAVALLEDLEVKYVILHLESYAPPELLLVLNRLSAYRHALLPIRDFGTELVFELRRRDVQPPSPRPTHVAAKLASVSIVSAPDSRAHETTIEVRLPSRSRVSGLKLLYGPHPRIPARRIALRVLEEEGGGPGVEWETPPDWPALAELIAGLLDNPQVGAQTLRFDPIEMERCVIRLESLEGRPDVSAIEVLGSAGSN